MAGSYVLHHADFSSAECEYIYSGTSLIQTLLRQKRVSVLERCPVNQAVFFHMCMHVQEKYGLVYKTNVQYIYIYIILEVSLTLVPVLQSGLYPLVPLHLPRAVWLLKPVHMMQQENDDTHTYI